MARLTRAEIFDSTENAFDLCNSLLDDHKLSTNPEYFEICLFNLAQKLQSNPILFAVALSAAAQYMILAASKVYASCEKNHICCGQIHRWEDWKAVFKQARSVEHIKARNDALSAAISMDMAEQLFNSLKESEEKPLTSRQTSDESVQAEDVQARMESKRQKQAGKRAADNKIQATLPKGTISQLKPSNRFAFGKYLPTTPIPRFLSAIYPTYLPTTPRLPHER